MINRINNTLSALAGEIRNTCRPSRIKKTLRFNRDTVFVFLAAFILYAVPATAIFNTGLLLPHEESATLPCGFLGYDNYKFIESRGGGMDIAHPFIGPVITLYHYLFYLPLGRNAAALINTLMMSACIAGGVAGVYYWCRRLIGTPCITALLLAALLGVSFTALTTSFIIETYPPSFLLLILSLVALGSDKQRLGYYRKRTVRLFAFLLGGITLTNVAKPTLAFLLENSWHERLRRCITLTVIFTATLLIVFGIYTGYAHFKGCEWTPWLGLLDTKNYVNTGQADGVTEFFTKPLLIGDLALRSVYGENVLRPTAYTSSWWNIPTFLLGLSAFLGLIAGWKRFPFVRLLPLYLFVDIFVNLIAGYGNNETILFGAHWVFLLPMAVAPLFSIRKIGEKRALLPGLSSGFADITRLIGNLLLSALVLLFVLRNMGVILHHLL